MEHQVSPITPAQSAVQPGRRRLFWIVFFGALAAQIVVAVIEGVIDYLT